MDNRKSLSMAAIRAEDPSRLEQVGMALDIDAWGVVIALCVCTFGPMLVQEYFSYPMFGILVAGTLSGLAAWSLRRTYAGQKQEQPRLLQALLIPVGSVVTLAPLMLNVQPLQDVNSGLVLGLLAAAVLWFMGFCQKLHTLERVGGHVAGKAVSDQVKQLRLWCGVAVLTMGLGFGGTLLGGRITGAGVLMGAMTLITFTLLAALLCSRVSMAARQQAQFVRALREAVIFSETPPDEPNWVIGRWVGL